MRWLMHPRYAILYKNTFSPPMCAAWEKTPRWHTGNYTIKINVYAYV